MIAPLARILLRYGAGYLVLISVIPQGLADKIASDPDAAAIVGFILMVAVEGFYALAKYMRWKT